MSGADDLLHSVTRLSAALDRISKSVPRMVAQQAEVKAAMAIERHPPVAEQIPLPVESTPNADIAARLDSLIEQLRAALSSTTG